MGIIVAIAVGAFSFFIGTTADGPVAGVLFGGLMFGMAYGAFVWRPGEGATSAATSLHDHSGNEKTIEQSKIKGIDFPPHVVGNLIAQSLDVSCKIENISLAERKLIREAGVTIERYREEMMLLAGFSQEFAIVTLLSQSDVRAEVLHGYHDAWMNLGRHSGPGRVLYERFLERCPVYARAVSSPNPDSVSAIAIAFGGFLDADNPGAQVLALTFADGVFHSHFEGTQYALQKALLLPAHSEA